MTASRATVLVCLLLALVAGSSQLSITDFAVPSAVEAGTNAELQCRHAATGEFLDYVKWWFMPQYAETASAASEGRLLLYQRLGGRDPETPRKNVEIKADDTIVITDLKSYDSGVYECEVSTVAEVRKHQELVVYSNGTGVELQATKVEDGEDDEEEEKLEVSCGARDVTPSPELLIFVNGKELENVTQHISESASGLFDAYVNATVESSQLGDSAVVRCELFFDNRNVTHPPYAAEIEYRSGAAPTDPPASSTPATRTQLASELKNDNGAVFHASSRMIYAAAIIIFYFLV